MPYCRTGAESDENNRPGHLTKAIPLSNNIAIQRIESMSEDIKEPRKKKGIRNLHFKSAIQQTLQAYLSSYFCLSVIS
jgi:hypothetical protein